MEFRKSVLVAEARFFQTPHFLGKAGIHNLYLLDSFTPTLHDPEWPI
ncbi:MAG: hypothetical protein ACHQ2F_00470 [Desulfobaccales bacterium]